MNHDFYTLGQKPEIMKNVESGVVSHNEQKLTSKVILVEMTEYSLGYLETLDPLNFLNCVFIFHYQTKPENSKWLELFNKFKPDFFIPTKAVKESHLKTSLEHLRSLEQELNYKHMVLESKDKEQVQNQSLIEELKEELIKTKKSVKRAELVKFEEELNLKALELIFDAQSVGEIEDLLLENLRDPLNLKWLRILISPTDHLQDLPIIKFQNIYQIKSYSLDYFKEKQGSVVFAFDHSKKIKINTGLLLQRVTDALSLRIKQLSVQSEIETTNHQWESTFEALPFKAALIDKDYNIVQKGGEFTNVKTKGPCYKTFFNKEAPCAGCKLGETFLIDQKSESLEVISKETFDPVADDYYFLNFYRDFEVSTLGETRKATRSKLEELGIISGSIAHELNNPLGGIKILLELLEEEEELRVDSYKEDLEILKNSTSSCIHIVRELLSFTRPQKDSNPLKKTLKEYFNQLKTFTQAYLLSEGLVLVMEDSKLLDTLVTSPDATLPIRLLEVISQFAKESTYSSTNHTKELLFSAQLDHETLSLSFSTQTDKKPSQLFPSEPAEELTLKAGHTRLEFNENKDCLTVHFDLEVKTSATHV